LYCRHDRGHVGRGTGLRLVGTEEMERLDCVSVCLYDILYRMHLDFIMITSQTQALNLAHQPVIRSDISLRQTPALKAIPILPHTQALEQFPCHVRPRALHSGTRTLPRLENRGLITRRRYCTSNPMMTSLVAANPTRGARRDPVMSRLSLG
jgi:hypothetical protein